MMHGNYLHDRLSQSMNKWMKNEWMIEWMNEWMN